MSPEPPSLIAIRPFSAASIDAEDVPVLRIELAVAIAVEGIEAGFGLQHAIHALGLGVCVTSSRPTKPSLVRVETLEAFREVHGRDLRAGLVLLRIPSR